MAVAKAADDGSAPGQRLRFTHVDAPQEVRDVCVDFAREALAASKVECDIAMHVKRKLEAHTGDVWHVIVGRAFGASVAHEGGRMVVFSLNGVNFCMFSSFDESTLIRPKKKHHVVASQSKAEGNEDAGDDAQEGGAGT